jgi:hypothetical protein
VPVGNDGETLVADSSTTTGLRYQADFAAGKNKIINGDFSINQRAFTSTTTNSTFGFDRWQIDYAPGTLTYSAQTFTPGTAPVAGYESTNFARFDITGQTTSSSIARFRQRIEDVRTFAGQTVTISFWAKAASGTPSISIQPDQSFGSGGSTTVVITGQKITLSTSWARYSKTFSFPSISGKTIGSGSFVTLNCWISAGVDFNARTDSLGLQTNTFDIWGVQVEAGSVATAFQTATGTIQGELAACQRYYYRMGGDALYQVIAQTGWFPSSTQANLMAQYPVQMRTAPSSVDFSTLQAVSISTGSAFSLSSAAINTPSTLMCYVSFTVSGASGGQMLYARTNNSLSGYLGFSAEL